MSNRSEGLSDELQGYMVRVGVREDPLLARLRDETAPMPNAMMQISVEQGAFMALLARAIGARRYLEIGTFTGYSSLAVALALRPDGRAVCLDVSEEWTSVARRYWEEAGVADRVELRLGPAIESLAALRSEGLDGTFDMAFVDAEKTEYPAYHEGVLPLMRQGGLIIYDNVFGAGGVADPDEDDPRVVAMRAFNAALHADERIELSMIPVADGLTLALKR